MNYEENWKNLKSNIMSRAEYFFYASSDGNELAKSILFSLEVTLDQMNALEKIELVNKINVIEFPRK